MDTKEKRWGYIEYPDGTKCVIDNEKRFTNPKDETRLRFLPNEFCNWYCDLFDKGCVNFYTENEKKREKIF